VWFSSSYPLLIQDGNSAFSVAPISAYAAPLTVEQALPDSARLAPIRPFFPGLPESPLFVALIQETSQLPPLELGAGPAFIKYFIPRDRQMLSLFLSPSPVEHARVIFG